MFYQPPIDRFIRGFICDVSARAAVRNPYPASRKSFLIAFDKANDER